jgi:hypothetical protein
MIDNIPRTIFTTIYLKEFVLAVAVIEIINNTRGGIEFKNWERS